ncbi:PhzF family phenazine biosynthesis protein [Spirillospora sp. CA-255316]
MRASLVDAFADERYEGNPAAVIVTPAGFPSERRMQGIAGTLPVPTTAFVIPLSEDTYRIRWFTPEKELNVCGHATIATAWYLYEVVKIGVGGRLEFRTQHGPLYTARSGPRVTVDMPCVPTAPWAPPAGVADALGARIVNCERAADDVVLELETAEVIAGLDPDFAALGEVDCRGVVVTARGHRPGLDFVSRSFFPSMGVDEDQVCVSAHGKLAPYWQRRLGRDRMSAVQLSPRGGSLHVAVIGDRVQVSGTARVRGTLEVN